jgi:hypothetical protein
MLVNKMNYIKFPIKKSVEDLKQNGTIMKTQEVVKRHSIRFILSFDEN